LLRFGVPKKSFGIIGNQCRRVEETLPVVRSKNLQKLVLLG
jgi:hypothetical protein